MRRISVLLDDSSESALDKVLTINGCTTSDVVNAALMAFSYDTQPVLPASPSVVRDLKAEFRSHNIDIDQWCDTNHIKKYRMFHLVNRVARGGVVCGFGNEKNKWRDKKDDRQFKTHTAWIAHCLKRDINYDIT
jgi:hypothetical protein